MKKEICPFDKKITCTAKYPSTCEICSRNPKFLKDYIMEKIKEEHCCATTWSGRICANKPKYKVRYGSWLCEYHINFFNKNHPEYSYKKVKGAGNTYSGRMNMPECPKCGKEKPSEDFYDYNTGGNTHTYWCKDCIEHYIKHTSVGAN